LSRGFFFSIWRDELIETETNKFFNYFLLWLGIPSHMWSFQNWYKFYKTCYLLAESSSIFLLCGGLWPTKISILFIELTLRSNRTRVQKNINFLITQTMCSDWTCWTHGMMLITNQRSKLH
jgi:hypothetical protein